MLGEYQPVVLTLQTKHSEGLYQLTVICKDQTLIFSLFVASELAGIDLLHNLYHREKPPLWYTARVLLVSFVLHHLLPHSLSNNRGFDLHLTCMCWVTNLRI